MHTTCFFVTAKTSPDSVLSSCNVMLPCCAVVCLLGCFWQSHDCNCRWAFVWLLWHNGRLPLRSACVLNSNCVLALLTQTKPCISMLLYR